MWMEISRDVFVWEDALTPETCAALIERCEAQGFERAGFGGARGQRVAAVRDNDRIIEDDAELTESLWDRLEPELPERWRARDMMQRYALGPHHAVGLNERVRWYRYREGQRFRPHVDKAFVGEDGRVSCHTILVYLNTLESGATRLELAREERRIEPQTGLMLCFGHHLMHEGMPVVRGTKYVLRTDLMWRKA